MRYIYSVLIFLSKAFLQFAALFSPKLKLFVQGRKNVWTQLQALHNQPVVWFHCASLGEYEQGLPVMEQFKKDYPKYKLLVTFFSPSGYEHKKDSSIADMTTYLPLDTLNNAHRFLDAVNPAISIFIKYEFWPNYLFELQKKAIPTFLISALFRENQIFFKFYGSLMRKSLHTFSHIFVQDEPSSQLLQGIGYHQVTVSGDTRYDRVSQQIEADNHIEVLDQFKHDQPCVVAGSTWPEDENLLVDYINTASKEIKFVIAPHNLKESQIAALTERLQVATVRFSKRDGKDLIGAQVFILDTIGMLKKAYYYADIAYVGGGMGTTGLHNILEAATFGVPIVIGKNFSKFPEAAALQNRAGLYSVADQEELKHIFDKLLTDQKFREHTGMICGHFVQQRTGATRRIMEQIHQTIG